MAATHARSTFSAPGASLTVLFCVLIFWAGVTYPTLWTAGDRDPDTLLLFLCILLWLLDRRRAADVRDPIPGDAHATAASH